MIMMFSKPGPASLERTSKSTIRDGVNHVHDPHERIIHDADITARIPINRRE
jgi:hypothetical protein